MEKFDLDTTPKNGKQLTSNLNLRQVASNRDAT